jgi:CheY-like chemotaxis protein
MPVKRMAETAMPRFHTGSNPLPTLSVCGEVRFSPRDFNFPAPYADTEGDVTGLQSANLKTPGEDDMTTVSTPAKSATRQFHALIVDDSTMTRKMIMKDLNDSGLAEFTFVEAGDGVEALDQYRATGPFDILFVDFQMPRKDGTEFLADLNDVDRRHPPAVMITSERSIEVMEKAADVGVKAFLLKPVDKDRLCRGLRKFVDSLPNRHVHAPSAVPHGGVIFGSIAVLGDVQWSLVLGFEQSAAAAVASRFAGMDIPVDSPEMGDAISELVNLVAGHVKRLLEKQGVHVEISLPVVNLATNIRTLTLRSTTSEHRHFRGEIGRAWTSVTVGMNSGLVL